jgi:hypothetical protein
VSTGYDIAAHIGFKPALSPVGLRVEGMFNQFDLKGTGTDFKAKILAGTANLVIMSSAAPGSMRPYFIGGAGVYNLKLSSSSLNASSDSETKFGLNGGAGLDLALSGINVFAEARYHHVFSKDDATGANNTAFVPLVVWPLALQYGGVVAPAPGGGGVIEAAFGAVLQRSIPARIFGASLIWWRFYTFYAYLPLGALAAGRTVLRALRQGRRRHGHLHEAHITGQYPVAAKP